MVQLMSSAELAEWSEYRKFLKERARQLPAEGSPLFVTKEKFRFSVEGKPWMGHAVLFEKRGEKTARALKKEQVRFREGWCVRRDGELVVSGVPPAIVKAAEKTMKRLKIGLSLVLEDAGAEDDAASGDVAAKLSKLEAKNLTRAKRLSEQLPDARTEIAQSLREAVEKRRAGDLAGALESQEVFDATLDALEREADENGADDPAVRRELERSEAKNRTMAQKVVGWMPDMRSHVNEMFEQIDDLIHEGELSLAVQRHKDLREYLAVLEASARRTGLADEKAVARLAELRDKNRPEALRLAQILPDVREEVLHQLAAADRNEREGMVYDAVRQHEELAGLLEFLDQRAAMTDAGDPELTRKLERKSTELAPRVARLRRLLPSEAERIDYRVENVRTALGYGDLQAAIRAQEVLETFLDDIDRELVERGSNDPAVRARLQELESKIVSRAKLVAEMVPTSKSEITASLRSVTKAKGEGDFNGAIATLEILDEFLTSVEVTDVLE